MNEYVNKLKNGKNRRLLLKSMEFIQSHRLEEAIPDYFDKCEPENWTKAGFPLANFFARSDFEVAS